MIAPPLPIPLESTTIPSVASTIAPTLPAPAPISVVVSPALRDEGQWRVLGSTAAGPVLWGTTVRPFATQPEVRASYATFDQSRLHAALFNGTELPGSGPWNNGSKVMPAAIPSLMAAFNGGFKFKHIKGGYFTEGKVIKPLLDGEATLAINREGRISIGVYGVDLTNDGSWLSLRQNLPLIIDGEHETVSTAHEQGTTNIYWGDDFGGVVLDFRSAICVRSDGLMMYAVVGRVDINGLVKALIGAHCRRAMELDINGSWPQFVSVERTDPASSQPNALDSRMTHLSRYLTGGSTKDFIALFDPLLLPPNVVR